MNFDLAPFKGALFDMDGVVTSTVAAHQAAWKHLFDAYLADRAARLGATFQPFDANLDYHRFVDGKPRYDGVESFLASRGITLPHGDGTDSPDKETICGLGNRKDDYFHQWLDHNQVNTYPGTLTFIQSLKQAGIKVAIFSSSRNATAVLRNASVLDLFDAKVDGDDLARQHLQGKPDPAMLLAAASLIGVAPGHALVVEDAIAGVQAGVRGGFGFVIGIDRGQNRLGLLGAGANMVVNDLAELNAVGAPPR